MPSIAIAVSGGGHRASLFGLGVLMYLIDAGKNREVSSITSVSGGSLTNGYVGQTGNYRQMSPEEFRTALQPFAERIASKGTLWAPLGTWLYVLLLVASLAAICAVCWLPVHWAARLGIGAVAVLAWAKLVAERRGAVCGWAFAKTLFSPKGSRTLLKDIRRDGIDHIICATDLHAGEHVYFSGEFVCSYRFGWGQPGDLRLDQAVQASAAFPFAFPCRWYRTARHTFRQGTDEARFMVLSDGGVYDNMGEQWAIGLAARKRRWPEFADRLGDVDELVAVNASAGMGWEPAWHLSLPLLGELLTLNRVINVLHDNTLAPRKLRLIDQFDRAARAGQGLRGALVTIEQSPFKVPDFFLANADDWPQRAERARAVVEALGDDSREQWSATARNNASVKTSLNSLGKTASARLLHHAYVLAMANLHVILDYPLLDIPPAEQFEEFVRGHATLGG